MELNGREFPRQAGISDSIQACGMGLVHVLCKVMSFSPYFFKSFFKKDCDEYGKLSIERDLLW